MERRGKGEAGRRRNWKTRKMLRRRRRNWNRRKKKENAEAETETGGGRWREEGSAGDVGRGVCRNVGRDVGRGVEDKKDR